MPIRSAECRQEESASLILKAEWVGVIPCRGQEVSHCAQVVCLCLGSAPSSAFGMVDRSCEGCGCARRCRRTRARKGEKRQSVGTNNSVAKPSVLANPNGIGVLLETGGIVRSGTDHPSAFELGREPRAPRRQDFRGCSHSSRYSYGCVGLSDDAAEVARILRSEPVCGRNLSSMTQASRTRT